jgi:hypothetical protein
MEGSGSVQIITYPYLGGPDPEYCLEGALCGLLQGLVAGQDGGHLLLYLLQLARVYLKYNFLLILSTLNFSSLAVWICYLLWIRRIYNQLASWIRSVILLLRSRVRTQIGSLQFIQDLKKFR